MTMRDFFQSLQERPYQQRLKLLWAGTAASAVVISLAWWGLAKLFPAPQTTTDTALLAQLQQGLNQAAEKFSEVTSQSERPVLPDFPADYRLVAVKSIAVNQQKKEVTVTVTISNPTADILVLLNPSRSNIILKDGASELAATSITNQDGMVLPAKILSKATYTGRLIFPLPHTATPTLMMRQLYFETQPSRLFDEQVAVKLNPADVKGAATLQLPRQ